METITVWTRQHREVLDHLLATGRHVAKAEFVFRSEDAALMRPGYDWLVSAHPDRARKPADADYPIWVSLQASTATLPVPDTVLLTLEVPADRVTRINVAKWGMVNNFSYIPADPADERRHRDLLAAYGVSDAKVCMTQFYPELKREIVESWSRVFDETIDLGGDCAYGLLWELRREWLREAIR